MKDFIYMNSYDVNEKQHKPGICYNILYVKYPYTVSIKRRIDFKILLITYKALKGLAPQYLSELLSHYRVLHVRCNLKTLAIW